MTNQAWKRDGLCAQADPDAWFPDRGESPRKAKAICRQCPVIVQCLRWALDHDERHGIWGGTTEMERRTIRAQRATTPQEVAA